MMRRRQSKSGPLRTTTAQHPESVPMAHCLCRLAPPRPARRRPLDLPTEKASDLKTHLPAILALLALMSGAAHAEWTAIGGSEQTTFYADLASRQAGADGKVKLWTMVSAATPRQVGEASFSSIRSLFEFDCRAQKVRGLESRFHAGTMAEGPEVGKVDEVEDWQNVEPGTVKEALSKVACDKP